MEQEVLYKAMMLQRQSEECEGQLKIVEEQIAELEKFSRDLEVFEKAKDKEMLSSLGKGIFVKTDVKDKKLFVDVGAGVVVRKTPAEARKVIAEQIKKFFDARMQLTAQLEGFRGALGEMIGEIEKLKAQEK